MTYTAYNPACEWDSTKENAGSILREFKAFKQGVLDLFYLWGFRRRRISQGQFCNIWETNATGWNGEVAPFNGSEI